MAMKYPLLKFWIGYSRGPNSTSISWVANHFGSMDAQLNWPAWTTGQPANSNGRCVSANHTDFKWSAESCETLNGIMCEIDTSKPEFFISR